MTVQTLVGPPDDSRPSTLARTIAELWSQANAELWSQANVPVMPYKETPLLRHNRDICSTGAHGILIDQAAVDLTDLRECFPPWVRVHIETGAVDIPSWPCRSLLEPFCGDYRLGTLISEPAEDLFLRHHHIYVSAYSPGSHETVRKARLRANAATLTVPMGRQRRGLRPVVHRNDAIG